MISRCKSLGVVLLIGVAVASLGGCRTIHGAVRNRQPALVRQQLIANPTRVNELDWYGRTPLHVAAEIGELNIAIFLLDRGAQVDAQDCNRRTPLHMAAAGGWSLIVKELLDRGADPNTADIEGCRPFDLAVNVDKDIATTIQKYGGQAYDGQTLTVPAGERPNVKPPVLDSDPGVAPPMGDVDADADARRQVDDILPLSAKDPASAMR